MMATSIRVPGGCPFRCLQPPSPPEPPAGTHMSPLRLQVPCTDALTSKQARHCQARNSRATRIFSAYMFFPSLAPTGREFSHSSDSPVVACSFLRYLAADISQTLSFLFPQSKSGARNGCKCTVLAHAPARRRPHPPLIPHTTSGRSWPQHPHAVFPS